MKNQTIMESTKTFIKTKNCQFIKLFRDDSNLVLIKSSQDSKITLRRFVVYLLAADFSSRAFRSSMIVFLIPFSLGREIQGALSSPMTNTLVILVAKVFPMASLTWMMSPC